MPMVYWDNLEVNFISKWSNTSGNLEKSSQTTNVMAHGSTWDISEWKTISSNIIYVM